MKGFDLFWRGSKQSQNTKEWTEKNLEFADKLNENTFRYKQEGLFDLLYEWKVLETESGSEVVERCYVTNSWTFSHVSLYLIILLFSFFMTGVGLLISVLMQPMVYFMSAMLLITFIFMVRTDSKLDEITSAKADMKDQQVPILNYYLVSAPFMFSTVFSGGLIKILSYILLVSISAYYFWCPDKERFLYHSVSKKLETLLDGMPTHSVLYLFFISWSIITSIMVINFNVVEILSGTSIFGLVLFMSSSIFIFVVISSLIYHLISTTSQQSYMKGFPDSESYISRKDALAAQLLITIIGSVFSVIVLAISLRPALKLLDGIRLAIAGTSLLLISSFAIYTILGLMYQVISITVSLLYTLPKLKKDEELNKTYQTKSAIYQLDDSGYSAGALTLGTKNLIFVSRGYLDYLDEDEIEALLAHEDGHIHHKDSAIAIAGSYLSPLLFIPKNVIFILLDFMGREFKADKFACDNTSPEQVLSLISKLQHKSAEDKIENSTRAGDMLPTITSPGVHSKEDSDVGFLTNFFGFFFGGFGVSSAHPSLGEREERVREYLLQDG